MIALTARAHAEFSPRPRRSPRRSSAARRTAGPAFFAPRRLALGACLLAAAAAAAYYAHSRTRPDSQPRLEAAAPPVPTPTPIPTPPVAAADAHKDDRLAALIRDADAEPAPPTAVKNPPPAPPAARSIVQPRDPALDAWFVKAYLRCWSPPAPLPPGEKYAAQIRVTHNEDGTLAGAPHLVNPPSDPAWRPYADRAVRAVTKCNPLQVPAQYQAHFDQWRKMTLYFSPDTAVD